MPLSSIQVSSTLVSTVEAEPSVAGGLQQNHSEKQREVRTSIFQNFFKTVFLNIFFSEQNKFVLRLKLKKSV